MIAGAVYQELYGFQHRPFSLTPDPDFLYPAASHQEAIEFLTYGLSEGLGFSVLTGEVGTGKTTLVHALLAQLPDSVKTAYVLNPVLSFPEILVTILDDLGIHPVSTRKADLLTELNRFLLEQHAKGCEVLVVIDEAHNLTISLLEELRMLSNLETSKAKLVHFLLIGQPELDALLDLPGIRQLKQRVGVRVSLRPLTSDETEAYIHHRLRVAGAHCRFTQAAADQVFRFSGGIPRLINQICHAALVAGYVAGARVITEAMVQRGRRELMAHQAGPPQQQIGGSGRQRFARVSAVLLFLTVATILGLAIILVPQGLP